MTMEHSPLVDLLPNHDLSSEFRLEPSRVMLSSVFPVVATSVTNFIG